MTEEKYLLRGEMRYLLEVERSDKEATIDALLWEIWRRRD